ncbi:MAG: non-homologous end-joining DNA ligase [Actinomycetota bacterium]|nr:non-homologous end-joining DNA ligase [Actinomycetota bacterium]
MAAQRKLVADIGGHTLSLSNLDKVLYPASGFTKGEVIDYYVRIAPALLAHLGDRGITMRRYPNGVDDKSFFEKRCPSHRPDWVQTAPGPGDRGGEIGYCRLADIASLAWAANLAALELHAPMARAADIDAPTMVVYDLDPGAPAGMAECAEVGLLLRDVLAGLRLSCYAKTSGSKGLQLYLPLNAPHTHEHASAFALAVAQALEKARPDLVVTTQAKAARPGKVLIDWSQNSRHKTTICVYSLRARPTPTVSTPVTWDEVTAAADGQAMSFEAMDVLTRVDEVGDLFEPTTTEVQHLPSTTG